MSPNSIDFQKDVTDMVVANLADPQVAAQYLNELVELQVISHAQSETIWAAAQGQAEAAEGAPA